MNYSKTIGAEAKLSRRWFSGLLQPVLSNLFPHLPLCRKQMLGNVFSRECSLGPGGKVLQGIHAGLALVVADTEDEWNVQLIRMLVPFRRLSSSWTR
jgi:hypothetical protein